MGQSRGSDNNHWETRDKRGLLSLVRGGTVIHRDDGNSHFQLIDIPATSTQTHRRTGYSLSRSLFLSLSSGTCH